MALFDGIENAPKKPRFQRCPVGLLLPTLSEEDAAGLQRALALPPDRLSAPEIRDVLKDEKGVSIVAEAIARHRRGACKCESA